jgi:hypothetical protein
MLHGLNKVTRLTSIFSLRTSLAATALFALLCAYEAKWVWQRRTFLKEQAAVWQKFANMNDGLDRDESYAKVEILTSSRPEMSSFVLIGERRIPSLDLLIVVEDNALDLARPMGSYKEVIRARRLCPDAQIVAAVIRRSQFETQKNK